MFTILKRRSTLALALLTTAGLAVAGCGSSSGGGQAAAGAQARGPYGASISSGSGAPARAAATGHATVEASGSSLGRILVTGRGRTLYLWKADQGAMSNCSGACAGVWPPLTTHGKPDAGQQVSAAKLGTTRRSDGSLQVTYNGHPLYLFAGDSRAGQTNGEGNLGFGAEWDVLSTNGSGVAPGM